MSQSIQLQVTQVGLEQSIAAAMKRVGNSAQINLGTNSKQINALSQPLGRITGQADEFSKSMAAANARVLAFGASAGIIAGVSTAMAGLLASTIKVEKSLVEINSVLGKSSAELDKFGQDIFNVAKNTGKSFDEVASGALELARQGLSAEDTLIRLNDALILSRLSGLDAAQSVEGLTAAFNSFQKSGITTAEILNKVVAISQKYAVSERDIIEGVKRSASVAQQAGVSFEELAALITAVQQTTARGGAVIGNSFKTIFARIQRKDVLSDLQELGVTVTDFQGNVLPALKILESLASQLNSFSQIEQASIAEKLGGVFQLDKLLASLKDLSSESSVTQGALKAAATAGNSAYEKNIVLNQTLSALLNKVAVSAEQLGAKLGEIGVTDSLKNVLGFFNNLLEGIQRVLGEESGLGNLVRGLVKGLGSFLAGPGLALFGAIILKLSKDLVQFGFASLKTFFGIGKAAKEVQNVESAISQVLAKNVNLQQQLFQLEGNRAAQLRLITGALVEQEALLRRSASISSGLAAPLYNAGVRAGGSGLRIGNSAGGYMPAVAKESKAIKQGVGGARSGDRPVVMPNFNFGGGKKGTMVAHSGEYVVPNFNGSGGSAVFNRQMVRSMGLPSGAKKIGAAGGFVPNFARGVGLGPAGLLSQLKLTGDESIDDVRSILSNSFPIKSSSSKAVTVKYGNEDIYITNDNINTSLKKRSQLSQELYYDSNQAPAALMLVPQNRAFNANALNTRFANKRNEGGVIFDGFLGGLAGVNPNPNDKKFSSLTNIDNEIAGALSNSAVNILRRIEPGIEIQPDSLLNPKNILNSVLAEGGAGAFGSFKGALFESIIKLVTKGKGQEGGRLDVDFDQGREALEAIFGIKGKGYKYADFKNSTEQKDKFISQVMTNLPVKAYPAKQKKGTASAAGGYIPNFAKYIYDSDRLAPDKGATLATVLASKVKKNLIIGPAGSGKSTYAGKMGQFLSGIDDVSKASEIDILSGAARAKSGISKNLESIIAAVNASGGKVSYLYAKNLEILSRRMGRTSPSEGDLRSVKQLKGTKYAPLNQFDFLSAVKSKAKNFNLINGAGGYVPNFVSKSRELGRGAQGAFYKLGEKDGTQVGVKKFFKDGPSKAVEIEWLVSEFLSKYANIPAVFGPRNLSTLEDSKRKRAIRKEVVSDPLAKAGLGSEKARAFGQRVLFAAFKARGLEIGDFHGSNYTINDNAKNAISGLNDFPIDPVSAFSLLRQIAASGGRIGAIDVGAARVTDPARTVIGRILEKQKGLLESAARGFLPNFASPLQDAVGREMAAGVPASQIYIDKSPVLKNAANPMGLMVANRRDEPAGGFQGINRARREGANPMMYGAAGGFVPNYAPQLGQLARPDLGRLKISDQAINDFNTSLKQISNQLRKGTITFADANSEVEQLAKSTGSTKAQVTKLAGIGGNLITAYNNELLVRREAVATRVLESNANKKIAKQLDKVYLEYNKSQKTTQDLQRAQAKAAAVLNQTSLGQRTQAAIVASTAGLAANRTSAQPRAGGDRDMLGTIFAVQGALSALTGATEGATGAFTSAVNGIASAAGTATTALFATQGLSQAFGGAESKIGGFIGKLGPYAAAAGFLYTGINEFTKYLDKTNPSVQKASESMLRVSDAASKAAVNLSTLNPIQQERIRKRGEDIIEKSRTYLESTAAYNPYGISSSKVRTASFEGVSNQLQTGFQELVSQAIGVGVNENYLNELIQSRFKSGDQMTASEIEEISNQLSSKISNIAKEGSPQSIIRGLTEDRKKQLAAMSPQEVEAQIAMRNQGSLKDLQEVLYGVGGVEGDIPRQEAIRKTIELLREQSKTKLDTENETIDQLKTSLAQDKLRNALANTIANARRFENDALEQSLLKGKELGNLTEREIRQLEDKIALRGIDRKLEDDTASIIQAQIDKAKGITAKTEEALALEERLKSLNSEDLKNKDLVVDILNQTNQLLSDGSALTDAQTKESEQKLDNLLKEYNLDKASLEANQDKTKEYREQNRQLDLIGQASKRALEAQSFNREIGTTRSINANDLRVRALESSKLGASDSQIRQIDQQIAAIKENTVALEQGNAREKVFNDFKSQLQENNKITNKTAKANIDNQIRQADTVEKLEDLVLILQESMEGADSDSASGIMQGVLQKFRQDLAAQDEASKQARSVAAGETADAGRTAPVISALEMFRRSLLENSQIIDQKIEDIKLQQLTSISGRELLQGNYDIETLRMQEGKTPEEAARIARERQNKSVSQLFNEEFGKTEEERALDMKKTIVDASVQFKNNMIEGIMGAVEGSSSLKDGLRSAAYEFVKTINQRMMSNLIDKIVGGNVQSGTGQTGGGLVGFLSGMFGKASGGMITGGSGMKDDVPAMLMGGEYVVNKKAVSKYGAQFLESINNGTLTGYAKGGKVPNQRGPQGNFYTPGTFGQGAIEGKQNLLDFATQTGTSGKFDKIINKLGFQSIDLESESSRLSVSGMRNSPMFEATQSAKGQAFDLYLQQYNQELEAKKIEKEQEKALRTQLIMLAASAAFSAVGGAAGTGFKEGFKSAAGQGFSQQLLAGGKGIFTGSNGVGVLKNLFSGNFKNAFATLPKIGASSIRQLDGYDPSAPDGKAYLNNVYPIEGPIDSTFSAPLYFEKNGYNIDPAEFISKSRAIGGMIPSMSGIDTVPAMLSGGEFVMNRSAVQGIGAQNLQSMNSGGTSITSEETSKELNEKLLAKLDELINASGSAGNITINVAPSGQTSQETSQDPSAARQQLARQIKDAVLQIINDEKRIGGSLRR